MTAYRLELPVSANDLVRPALLSALRCEGCGRTPVNRPIVRLVSTREAKDFRAHAHRRLPVAPVSGPVEVFATFFVDRISTDIDNRCKSLLDAMKGRLIVDDAQVAELHLVKVVTSDPAKVGVVVEVRPADPLEHPELSRRLASSSIAEQDAERRQGKLFAADKPVRPITGAPRNNRPVNTLPEPLQSRLNRLAKPAVVSNRPDDEPPEVA